MVAVVKSRIKVIMPVRKPVPRNHRLRLLVAMTRGLAPAGSMPLHSKAWYSTTAHQPARMNNPIPRMRNSAAIAPTIRAVFTLSP